MDIKKELENCQELMEILKIIEDLDLPDAWLCAGTLRNFIWNRLSGKSEFESMSDIDVAFFDPNMSYEETLTIQKKLQVTYPNYEWEVKNQCDMHLHSLHSLPYVSSCDAISKYPERCTAIAARLNHGTLDLFLPYGSEDIVNFMVRPTPHFLENEDRLMTYKKRQEKKKWQEKWPRLQIVFC